MTQPYHKIQNKVGSTPYHEEIKAILSYMGYSKIVDDEELIDEVVLDWLQKEKKFNPEIAKLSTFKFTVVKNSALAILKRRNAKFRKKFITSAKTPEEEIEHKIELGSDRKEQQALINRIKYFVNHLTEDDIKLNSEDKRKIKIERDIKLYNKVIFQGISVKSVSKQHRLSKERVWQIIKRIKKLVIQIYGHEIKGLLYEPTY